VRPGRAEHSRGHIQRHRADRGDHRGRRRVPGHPTDHRRRGLPGWGDRPPLSVTIVNHGRDPDRLVRVSSPIAAGSILVADGLTIPAGHTLTAGQAGPAGVSTSHEDGDNTVALTGLRVPIRSGLTYPVVFGFERAGDLLLEVPVDTPDVPR